MTDWPFGSLRITAFGFAARINGVLAIQTATDTRRGCALNAFWVAKNIQMLPCQDESYSCVEDALARYCPNVEIVDVALVLTDLDPS
jgi:hypothetical protein